MGVLAVCTSVRLDVNGIVDKTLDKKRAKRKGNASEITRKGVFAAEIDIGISILLFKDETYTGVIKNNVIGTIRSRKAEEIANANETDFLT